MYKSHQIQWSIRDPRKGSTLVIVIALLGLLSFLGIVFFTFASQERAASGYFSDAAKFAIEEPPNVFDHMLRHVLVGPNNSPQERLSILQGRRHSLIVNMIGRDLSPYSGKGVQVVDSGGGIPVSPLDQNGNLTDWLEFVDSPYARSHAMANYTLRGSESLQITLPPEPDVDYTSPDINSLFLAYKGTAILTDSAGDIQPVPVIIPSFLRPAYMKTSTANHPSGNSVPTDADWLSSFDGIDRNTAKFSARSFRPNPQHLAGRLPDGTPIFRYVTSGEAAGLSLTGGFPFIPLRDDQSGPFDPNGNGRFGEMGVWTGSIPSVYELDTDNDGDGTRDGIWLDLHYPVQETSSGKTYVVLHSVTIYDLDSLINLNVHGNLAGLDRLGDLNSVLPGLVRDGTIRNQFTSRSNQGMGPHEINPQWALRRGVPSAPNPQFTGNYGYGRIPVNEVEQANLEWIWLLAGRAEFDAGGGMKNVLPGRWGEAEKVYRTFRNPGGSRNMADLPRPGMSGASSQMISNGMRFGGTFTGNGSQGYDDNGDAMDGETSPVVGRLRPFGQPMDFSGAGRTTAAFPTGFAGGQFTLNTATNPLRAMLHHDPLSSGPERWLQYNGYSVNRMLATAVPRYIFGQNAVHEEGVSSTDDLNTDPIYDSLLDDPLETIFDSEFAQGKFDQIFSPADMIELNIPASTVTVDSISSRLSNLAPFALERVGANPLREKFTTLSNALRRFPMSHDLGPDLLFGTADDGPRAWEHSADTDGADQDGDGFADGDNPNSVSPASVGEFPPKFFTDMNGDGILNAGDIPVQPYSALDPFRPQVRRILTHEVGESRELMGQLPISLNHILDVERNAQTPDETAQPIQFLRYMQRAGLRFRPLTEHPSVSEGAAVLQMTTVPQYDSMSPVPFPPSTPEQREFWARRDRQKLCRDIYVLLYTIGGAQPDLADPTKIRDYRQTNNPDDVLGTALYTHAQLREMAQFAVNLVDAMDSDDVITKFEYDKNLGDGWQLDDDPYTLEGISVLENDASFDNITDFGRHREDSVDRGVVYGVEAQQLAFSEVLAVGAITPTATGDHAATLYNDATGRKHLFVELQGMVPTPISLTTPESDDMNTAIWRIVRRERKAPLVASDPIGGTLNGGLLFRSMAFRYSNTVTQKIDGGSRFVIGTASDSTVASSDLFVDYNLDNTFELIAPNTSPGTLPTVGVMLTDPAEPSLLPRCDLDLIHDNHANAFVMHNETQNGTTTKGDFLTDLGPYVGNDPMSGLKGGPFGPVVAGFDLVLQRRANTNLPSLDHGMIVGEDPNPWIDVDYVRAQFRDLGIVSPMETAMDLQTSRLPAILSDEREEPLNDGTRRSFSGTAANFCYNTISGTNSSTNPSTGFQLWQPHFDREFASPGEILNVPLFPPMHVTQMLDRARYSPFHQAFDDETAPPLPPDGLAKPELLAGAAAKFLEPDFPGDTAMDKQTSIERAKDNRWYRLFQFVEVPSRVHRMLGNYVTLQRVPGKLNINTLRHWEVYAGLIDNATLLDRETAATNRRVTVDRTTNEIGTSVDRDRWIEYLRSRDGKISTVDAANNVVDLTAPGTLFAKPFRSPGHLDESTSGNGIGSTLLRQNPEDDGNANLEWNRQLLEIGSQTQHATAKINLTGDPSLPTTVHRHQILSKVMNNTTTVSNTFIVFATAGYFEAVESPLGSGMIRVGSRIDLNLADGSPPFGGEGWQQKAVFLIDRTEAFKALNSGTGDVDWKRLIKARVTIE